MFQDEDPYVRKTAAVCVAKLFDINAQLVEDQGFLDQLRDLLSDSNPMVCFFILSHMLFFKRFHLTYWHFITCFVFWEFLISLAGSP